MVRLRLGSTWKQDPALRAALARGGPAAAEAALGAVDAVALEIDGVDVVAGRAEGPLLGSVLALGEAALRLCAGSPRAEVHFSEGGVELLLARRAQSALLTVVALERPARVLARGIEVDLLEFARAVEEVASALERELDLMRGRTLAPSRALRQLKARLGRAEILPGTEPRPAVEGSALARRERADAPTCTFELADEDGLIASYRGPGADLGSLLCGGRVALRTVDGREMVALAGPPFLVLRDLAAFAERIAGAARRGEGRASALLALPGRHATLELEADLERDTLRSGSGPPQKCPALPLARALLEAAVDFCGVVAARNAWQAENGWLSELRLGSAERLAHVQELLAGDVFAAGDDRVRGRRPPLLPRAPLGPGRVRRLGFRPAFEAEAGAPAGFGLSLCGDLLLVAGAGAVLGLDARSGAERWRAPGACEAALCREALYLLDQSRLEVREAASGRVRFARELDGLPEGTREVLALSGGLALLVGRRQVAALDPSSGETVFTFAPPAARELWATALGRYAVVGSDAGFLYGVETPSGRTAWRLRLPGRLVASPAALGADCLALCATELGGSLLALDASSGRRRRELPLDVTPLKGPLPFAGLWAVAGAVAGDPVVVAVDLAGSLAFEAAPPLGTEPVALTALTRGLLVKTSRGACVALDRAGATLWARTPRTLHPPPANPAALHARGLALVAGEHLEALDADTGELLGEAPLAAPVRLVAGPALELFGMDASGVVIAVRLATHLSLL
ncbi:MAG TPA: PQQ-binding-like beta-propeller repeat protein [Anaeromyxobacteraceae bacterium]|nr:PQQ-binding-like beta-propeller repeat protein [Anaeromyxobacteraceae bacterium]